MGGPRIVVVSDGDALGRAAAERVCASVRRSVTARGVAHVALTGGTTAGLLYAALASDYRGAAPWESVHFWWGDDRFVGFDDRDSNVRLVRTTLFGQPTEAREVVASTTSHRLARPDEETGLSIAEDHVHPFPIEEARRSGQGPTWAAEQYSAALVKELSLDGRHVPQFDLVLLGVGGDGHMLSCFPGSPLVDAPGPPWCTAVPAPTTALPAVPRVTCSPRLVEAAREVLVLVSGAGKALVMRRILRDGAASHDHPAVIATHERAVWLLDAAAAGELGHIPDADA